jgi:acyl-CoA synthetase (AMP-forming)/AMP-acid ligase II/thioesterase domain-containing protein
MNFRDRTLAMQLGSDSLPVTIISMLEVQARQNPEALAILAPGRKPLTYERLQGHVETIGGQLNSLGVGRNDRVSVVLPNGPEMAVTFLATAACATCAPLNPGYRPDEFEFYLMDLQAKALIVQAGDELPVVAVAQKLKIPVIELLPAAEQEAGLFTLKSIHSGSTASTGWAHPDDIALVLHTSGTTSRPKIVPLSQANICVSSHNIKTTLQLSAIDRCISVMPLFHIHGLMGALLSSLAAGASIVCTPGFRVSNFFDWTEQFRPTWYTAVPTMHQTILARASQNREIAARCALRFVRSSSSALSPKVMSQMEEAFNAPVIEAYGMTEAAHQMASNPLPPQRRKPGSVGIAAGPEIAIMDEDGKLLSPGEIGEIVIRGANVMRGYENNDANATAFTNGWFRTGDQGVMDAEGYLFIKGRLKEIINRGGEKISPREVDDVLLNHPAIAQAVTFATPHPALGEEVAAAVVLHTRASITEDEIRQFSANRLADFKVPRRILIVDEIPKGPTGKQQRIGLAEKLRLTTVDSELGPSERRIVAPRSTLELQLVRIWEEVLGIHPIGITDNFFDLGGYSLLAAELVERIVSQFGKELPLASLLDASNIEQQAKILCDESSILPWTSLVPIKSSGSMAPVYFVHGVGGNILGFRALAHHLGPNQPVYGLQSVGLDGKTPPYMRIEDMAAHYIKEILAFQPEGPYYLGGQSFGGTVAYEMARQLHEQRYEVAILVLLDSLPPNQSSGFTGVEAVRRAIAGYLLRVKYHAQNAVLGPYRMLYVRKKASTVKRRLKSWIWRTVYKGYRSFDRALPTGLQNVDEANRQAMKTYYPKPCSARIALFLAQERAIDEAVTPELAWKDLATGELEVYEVPGDHVTITIEPYVQVLAEKLKLCLGRTQARSLQHTPREAATISQYATLQMP